MILLLFNILLLTFSTYYNFIPGMIIGVIAVAYCLLWVIEKRKT